MADPGQALSYKIGALKIRELRNKYEKQLGSKFNIGEFHKQVLNSGCLPLSVLEEKLDKWAKKPIIVIDGQELLKSIASILISEMAE
jgi:uncharacterized protein (DUF885 family)